MNREDKPIPITRPSLGEQEKEAVCRVLDSGWLVQGRCVAELEQKFAHFTRSKEAVAVSSCTAGLHLALLASGVGPGDEVLIPSFTYIATANSVEYVGAKPVFIDINLSTFIMNIEQATENLEKSNKKAKVIMPVSLFGLCLDMPSINDLAEAFHLHVIEDAACGLGGTRHGHHAGSEALAGCFSFHPRKVITTGEGGMVITRDEGVSQRIRELRNHGAATSDFERHFQKGGSLLPRFDVLGYNYRMTDLQAAIGVVQMEKVDEVLSLRYEKAQRYHDLLRDIEELRRPFEPEGYHHGYQSFVCLYWPEQEFDQNPLDVDWKRIEGWNLERNRLMARLEAHGISVRQGTHAVHTLGYYKKKYNIRDHDFPMSFIADRLSLTLPLFPVITDKQQCFVRDRLKELIYQMRYA